MEACRLAVVQAVVGGRGRRSARRWARPCSAWAWARGPCGRRTSACGSSTRRSRWSSSRSSRARTSCTWSRRRSTSSSRSSTPRGAIRQDREHRGGREPRHLEARGVLVEAAARLRRLRRVRPLPGGVPRVPGRHRARPEADHRQAQAPPARRAAGADPRRADQGRRAVGVHDLHGVRAGVPGLHRHRRHHHRPPALPHALRGRAALDGPAVAAEHPARRQPVGAAGRRAAGVGARASTCPCWRRARRSSTSTGSAARPPTIGATRPSRARWWRS